MNDIKQFTDCVGPGWKDIITSLYEDLIKLGWDRKVYQVKEKFGGLRFYIGEGTTEIFDRIALAEEASLETCEECGKPGTRRYEGWVKTLCDEHAEMRK